MLATRRAVSYINKKLEPVPLYPFGLSNSLGSQHLGGNLWLISVTAGIAQTGASFSTDYAFLFPHRILELYVNHTTAAGADSTDALDFKYETHLGGVWVNAYETQSDPNSSIILSFLDEGGRVFPVTVHRFTTNTTATNIIRISMKIEVLKN